MRVSPHCFNSRRAYASLVATSIPAFRRPCTPPAGFWAAPGFASSAPFLQRRRQDGSINLNNEEPSPGFENCARERPDSNRTSTR